MEKIIKWGVLLLDNKDIEKNKLILKELLLKLKILKEIKINNSNNVKNIKKGLVSNIQKYNKINNWKSQVYKFNKTELINTINLDKLVKSLIKMIITLKLYVILSTKENENTSKKIERSILISDIIIKHKLNKVIIKFYYNIGNKKLNSNNKYYISSINIWLNTLTSGVKNNGLNNLLSNYYNKEVEIQPIYLKYNYLNSNIFMSSIKKELQKNRKFNLQGRYNSNLINTIPVLNNKNIALNYIKQNKIIFNNELNKSIQYLNNNLNLLNKNNNNNINIKSIYNIKNNNQLFSQLLFKNIIGWSLLIKGRLISSGVNRTTKILLSKGTFINSISNTSNLFHNVYKLNSTKVNLTQTNSSYNYIKYGKIGLKLKLNTI
ncbi:ribosomal protein VAR1 (mitochondrion) [Komagataella phaffii]|uniref:ribosomal protein VAR1, mitochondrial n=1 Tax=Komagataella phaffii (strain ATCC 76273 / CBS 7435 / CECT 11047 / NRRL Y-11430 / Wegner 21-1) TaxID=981350 RepID=UPI00020490EE|nr:ribosomal protein VAR1, mitochondrial [Komagataella phaffii CBS 7435]